MNIRKIVGFFSATLVFTAYAQIQTAGNLLIDVTAASLSGLTNNAVISAWSNAGTLGGNFIPAVSGQGARYQTNVAGIAAVTFAGSANSVMTNTVPPPSTILSNAVWSAELWVLNPTLQSPEDQFCWTDRGNWTGSSAGRCMEIRYCADAANAVEHYDSAYNIQWSGNPPLAGLWHHMVITRDASGVERLYADGVLRTTKTPPSLNLREGAPFTMGGVWDRGSLSWQYLFSGSLGMVRVHSGTLTTEQVVSNYTAERGKYQSAWSGAAGVALPWEDSANWVSNTVATTGSAAWIDNGGVAVLSSSLALAHLYPNFGGLVITNGATLTLGAVDNVQMGIGGNPFTLSVVEGAFKVPGASTMNLYMGSGGSDVTATIGGTGASAAFEVDRDTIVANSSGSVGTLTVGAGGSVYNSNGWFYVANNIGAQGQLIVNGGTLGFRLADKDLVVNVNGARGDVIVNSGLIRATGNIKWSANLATNIAYGRVQLNGGTLEAKRFFGENTAGTNLFYLNGGTVKAVASASDFMYNLTGAYIQNGGAIFDIPSGISVTAAQALLADAGSTGGLIKRGTGRITLAGANTFAGSIDVLEGDLFFSATNGLPANYAGAITLTNSTTSAIGYAKPGAPAQLLARMSTNSVGYLTLFLANSADMVDFSSFPSLQLAFSGVTNYTGTFIPYNGNYSFKTEGAVVTNAMVMVDGASVAGHVKVVGSSGGMFLTGVNTFTGGVEVDGSTVVVGHVSALGTQATIGVPDVELRNGAVLNFAAEMDVNAFIANRLKTTSSGFILLGAANAGKSVDLSNHPGVVVGAGELTLDYTGSVTPATALNAYRLGGGNATYNGTNYRGFSVSNLSDGASANSVVIGTPGIVELKAGNTYSGRTVVTNRGVLFLKEDGLGAVPATPDATNLTVDNGVIRFGFANFTVHTNRGLFVGNGGLELHPWGGYTATVGGNLSGSGKITVTDSGWVTFGGAANTYSGLLDISSGRNIRIGNGANFSWSGSSTFALNGTLALKTDTAKSFGTTLNGGGSLRKEGTGALTLTTTNSYSGVTYVDAGSLKVANTNVLPRGAGKGIVEIAAGAQLDANGLALTVGGLQGNGAVVDSAATAGTFAVGETNVTAVFSGTIAPALTLVKVGAGKQSLANTVGAANQVEVKAGTLELVGAAAVTGTVTLAGGTLAISSGATGLMGSYYTLSTAPLPSDFVSYAAVTNFFNGKTPTVVSNSWGFGATFNALPAGSRFPAPYNGNDNFAALWTGSFWAEKSGEYGFSTASDDGSVLFINEQLVVDNNSMQSYTGADSNVVTTVTLSAGLHRMTIAFYEAAGDQGLTVFVRKPGAANVEELPNALLFTGINTGDANVGALAGSSGNIVFANQGPATLRVTGNSDMTYASGIISSNANSRFIKQGSGTLALSSSKSDQLGTLEVESGTLALTNGPATLGTLTLSAGATATVTGSKGLSFYFYNRSATDDNYSEFQSMAAWESYLSSTFPAGPSYVTNSIMLGTNLDTGDAGTAWPTPYVQGSGAEQETYDAYLFGSIYLDRTGTYTFATASDDGSMLYIDRTLVVTNGYNQGVTQRSGTINLTAGFHRIDVLYRENTGGNALRVYIGYPGQSLVMMPQSILFGGSVVRGLAGASGATLNLGAGSSLVLNQETNTVYAGTLVGDASTMIQKNGSGMITLTDDNAGFAGSYSVTGGTLRVGNGGFTGALGPTASVYLGTTGRLVFNRAGTVTVGGVFSGTGLIVLDGPGDVYVTSASSFAGKVQINAGRLIFAPGATLGSASVITNASGVTVETTGTRLQSAIMGDLQGSGDLLVSGTGVLALNASNTNFTGTTRVVTGATVRLSGPLNLGGRGSVDLDGGSLSILPTVFKGTNQLADALNANTWSRNGNASWLTRYDSTWLQVTPNSGSQAGSAFYTNKVTCGGAWYASFRYEVGSHPDSAADGIAFLLQNDPRGITALGASGGAIGASGIVPSIGIFINIYQAASVGWITNGVKIDAVTALNGIIPTNGVDVALVYDGVALSVTLTQGEKTYTATRTANLSEIFANNPVYVGFTGGTGGATAQQFVGNFSLYDAQSASTDFNNRLSVNAGRTGTLAPSVVNADLKFQFAGLDLGSASVLNVVAGDGSRYNTDYTVGVSNVTLAAGIGTIAMAANGTGRSVLALNTLTYGSNAKLVVTGGAVSVPGGMLRVVMPTPVPKGVTYLADFQGSTWSGSLPTSIVLVDLEGNPIEETIVLRNGLLYINTIEGTVIILR